MSPKPGDRITTRPIIQRGNRDVSPCGNGGIVDTVGSIKVGLDVRRDHGGRLQIRGCQDTRAEVFRRRGRVGLDTSQQCEIAGEIDLGTSANGRLNIGSH